MSAVTERLAFLFTTDASSAIKGFEKVGDSADKNLSKAEARLDKVGGNLTKFGAGAIASAGLVGGALVKAAGGFENLALKAVKFSATTGIATEAGSRLIEVASDMHIEVDTVAASLNKMNIAADKTPEKFKAIGADLVRTKDGALDVNATFANVVQALSSIKDPAERAHAATELLGRGWTGMSELIAGGSEKLKQSLKEVGDAQAITPAEAQTAKDYRADLDHLSDSASGLALAIGKSAAPVIGGFADALGSFADTVGRADAATDGLAGQVLSIATVSIGAVGAISAIAGQAIKMRNNLGGVVSTIQNLTGATSGLSAGLLGGLGIVSVAVSAYALLADEKAQTTQATEDLTAALVAEADGQKGAVNALLGRQIVEANGQFKGYLDTLHKLGLTEKDLAEAVAGKTVPAFDKAFAVLSAARGGAAHYTEADKAMAKQLGISSDEADTLVAAFFSLGTSYEDATRQANLTKEVTNALAGAQTGAADATDDLASSKLPKLAVNAKTAHEEIGKLRVTSQDTGLTMGGMGLAAESAAEKLRGTRDAIDGVGRAYDRLTGKFSAAASFKELADSAADLAKKQVAGVAAQDELTKAVDAYNKAVKSGSAEDRAKALEAVQAAQEHVTEAASDTADAFIRNGQLLADHALALKNIPPELTTKIETEIDQGAYALAEAHIKALERTRYVEFDPVIHSPGGLNANKGVPLLAGGTNNWPGGPAVINDGPGGGELVGLPSGAVVVPADKTDRILAGAGVVTNNYNVTIHEPPGYHAPQLADGLRWLGRRRLS